MISDAELIDYIRPATEGEIETIRRLERAAVAAVQNQTGRYFGPVASITDTVLWRQWFIPLSGHPIGGVLTSAESWGNSSWTAFSDYQLILSNNDTSASAIIINRGVGSWTPLSMSNRYRVTYQAGYAELGADEWAAPDPIKQAVIMLTGHWFENRESVTVDASADPVQQSVDYILAPYTRASC